MPEPTSILPAAPKRPAPDTSLAIVNIVLLLLFFFLATGSLMGGQSFPLLLPETKELEIEHLPKPVLTVTADGGYELNGAPLDAADLPEALAPLPLIHLVMARNAPAHELVTLLNRPVFADKDVKLVTVYRRGTP